MCAAGRGGGRGQGERGGAGAGRGGRGVWRKGGPGGRGQRPGAAADGDRCEFGGALCAPARSERARGTGPGRAPPPLPPSPLPTSPAPVLYPKRGALRPTGIPPCPNTLPEEGPPSAHRYSTAPQYITRGGGPFGPPVFMAVRDLIIVIKAEYTAPDAV